MLTVITHPRRFPGMGAALRWNRGRKLASATKNGVATSYAYSADGLRLSKTVGGQQTNFLWSGDLLQEVRFADGRIFGYMYNESGAGASATYTYDNYNLTSITTGGQTYTFNYREFPDELANIKIDNATLIQHTYENNHSRLDRSTYGKGQQTSFPDFLFFNILRRRRSIIVIGWRLFIVYMQTESTPRKKKT